MQAQNVCASHLFYTRLYEFWRPRTLHILDGLSETKLFFVNVFHLTFKFWLQTHFRYFIPELST